MQYNLCCVGHITLDKVTTPQKTIYMPGGTSFYCSRAISGFGDIRFKLVTRVGASELNVVESLRAKGIDTDVKLSRHSVYFENIYGENQDNRTQRVLAKADPFSPDMLQDVDAQIYLLGALLADDFPNEVVKHLSTKGLVAIDSQGYLREVRDTKVFAVNWEDKKEVLKYTHFLKANEEEMEVLTGHKDIRLAARQLYGWGVREVIITMGSMGSVVYDGSRYYQIPAYRARQVVDATGCGDTYMTGYLYKRSLGEGIEESARFGAAMATLKIERTGPFSGNEEDVDREMSMAEEILPGLI